MHLKSWSDDEGEGEENEESCNERGQGGLGKEGGGLDQMGNGTTVSPHALCSPFFKDYAITAEYNLFTKRNIPGVYAIPKAHSSHEWFGLLFIRQGLYQGAILRFTLIIPKDFPKTNDCPQLIFEIAIFHPLVCPATGELDLKRAFPLWRHGTHRIYQVFEYVQRIFYSIDPQHPVNAKAAKLFEQDPEQYRMCVAESVKRSREAVYDAPKSSDPHAVRITPWDPSVHELVRNQIFKQLGSFAKPDCIGTSESKNSGSNHGGVSPGDSGSDFPSNAQTSGLSWFSCEKFQALGTGESSNKRRLL